ncbi:MAG: hypothetical protein ABEH47_01810 [Haloferacaceae archaeon]
MTAGSTDASGSAAPTSGSTGEGRTSAGNGAGDRERTTEVADVP